MPVNTFNLSSSGPSSSLYSNAGNPFEDIEKGGINLGSSVKNDHQFGYGGFQSAPYSNPGTGYGNFNQSTPINNLNLGSFNTFGFG